MGISEHEQKEKRMIRGNRDAVSVADLPTVKNQWLVMVHVMDAKSRLQKALRRHQLKRIMVDLVLFAFILLIGVCSMAWTMHEAGFDAVSAQLSHSEYSNGLPHAVTRCRHALV